jgi:hypothetical protein
MKRKKQKIRVLFAGLFVFLFLQSALILFLGEPWPSISFPRFSAPGGQTQTFTVAKPVLTAHFAEAEKKKVEIDRFLDTVPSSHHTTVINENYRPASSPGNEKIGRKGDRTWTKRVKDWAANTLRSSESEVAPARTEEGARWTRNRLNVLFPARTLSQFEVQWHEMKYERSGDHLIMVDRKAVDSISISFKF